jgi:hypothetical protein
MLEIIFRYARTLPVCEREEDMKKELNGKKANAVGQSDIKCLFLLHLCVLFV